jgi:integrase
MLKIVRRTKGGHYYLRGTVAGQAVYESTQCSGRAAADAIRIRRETEIIARHAKGKAATLTFAEAALTYLESGGQGRYLAKILQHFGADTLLDDVDNGAVNAAASALYPRAAPATINRSLITPISAVVNMAAENDLARYRKFKRRKTPPGRTRWLTPEEAERLIHYADPHLVPILFALLGTGARVSEILGTEAHFYYPATSEIWLPDTKNGHPRMISLPGRAAAAVAASTPPEAGRIFLTPKRQPYILKDGRGGQIKAAFDTARLAAGLGPDVVPHSLRHTWATWFYSATKDFGGLLDKGGWQKSDMANRYRKIAPADLPDRLLDHGWQFGSPLRGTPARQGGGFQVVEGGRG